MHFMNLGLFTNNSGTYLLTVNEIAIHEYLQGLIDGCPPVGQAWIVALRARVLKNIFHVSYTPHPCFHRRGFFKMAVWARVLLPHPRQFDANAVRRVETHGDTKKKQYRVPLDVHY